MPLGISPLNDFAFKKTFGAPENRAALISLLNAILLPITPIVEVTILNPFKVQDFRDDKLSVVDIKAVDQAGAIYDIEVQLDVTASLIQRVVFYGCELYADQLREGIKYDNLRPVYSIWLIDGILWRDAPQFHHAFRLTDAASGRALNETLEIHTIELPKYNSGKQDLALDDMLGCWLYWLRHAQEHDAAELREILPQPAIRQATATLLRIAEITEDKTMYDARERAIRDRQWELDAAMHAARVEGKLEGKIEGKLEGKIEGKLEGKIEGKLEGKIEGKIEGAIKTVCILQGLLNTPLGDEQELRGMSLEQLDTLTVKLQEQLRSREPS